MRSREKLVAGTGSGSLFASGASFPVRSFVPEDTCAYLRSSGSHAPVNSGAPPARLLSEFHRLAVVTARSPDIVWPVVLHTPLDRYLLSALAYKPRVNRRSIGSLWLILLGGMLGRRMFASAFDYPCRVKDLPSPLSARKMQVMQSWAVLCLSGASRYHWPPLWVLCAGATPFLYACPGTYGVDASLTGACSRSVWAELDEVLSIAWSHIAFPLHWPVFFVLLSLVPPSCAMAIAFVYLQLRAEDPRWWWRSFLYAASPAAYVFAYSIHYAQDRGLLVGVQGRFYVGYMALVSLGLFFVLGTLGFLAAFQFVRSLYRTVKTD